MKKYLIFFIVLGIGVAAYSARNYFESAHLSLSANENLQRWSKANPGISLLKTGDLIFRHGRGFISNALMSLGQREKKYSHSGIVSIENGKVFVYHAIGGEENLSNKLRKDPLSVFCEPKDVHAFGIYRTDLNEKQIHAVMSLVSTYFQTRLEFDPKFDLATDDKMYCTEFVYKVFERALGKQNYISLSTFTGKQYIACDDLYCNSHCQPIYSYQY
ncbi:MAG: YiiX/YebB-like N1pC/P60 family cysteine hydrolase [Bacteroidota bacterium]